MARVLLCLVFLNAVISKLTGFAGTAALITSKGLPLAPVLVVLSILLMLAGSAIVISGRRSRLGVVLLLIFLIPTTLIFHGNGADPDQRIQFLKNLSIIAGLLFVFDQDNT